MNDFAGRCGSAAMSVPSLLERYPNGLNRLGIPESIEF